MDKRGGIIMPLYVLLFVAMCGSAIMMSLASQDNVQNSIASPLTVLEARERFKEFELAEAEVIRSAYLKTKDSDLEFNTPGFLEGFRKNLLKDSYEDSVIRDYLVSGVYYEGRKLSNDFDWDSFFNKVLYPNESFYFEDSSLVFTRHAPIKKYELEAKNTEDHINFRMNLDYSVSQKYYVSFIEDKVVILDEEGNLFY